MYLSEDMNATIIQAAHSVLMVRPAAFGNNPETAASNIFQQTFEGNAAEMALREFDNAVKELKKAGVKVHVFEDTSEPVTPDSVFPNNWFMTTPQGHIVIGAMSSGIRRGERRGDIIDFLKENYVVEQVFNLSAYEDKGKFLECTGSIVFDHLHQKAYATASPRTDENLFIQTSLQLGYKPIVILTRDKDHKPIYHTNVMMSIGSGYAVVCLDALHPADHELVLEHFAEDEIKVVSISYQQMTRMAGNILEVGDKNPVLIMSTNALESLLPGQVHALSKAIDIVDVNIPTIEQVGGGGIRCMLAGIHLPNRYQ